MIIYRNTPIRGDAFEIDDDEREFVRDPTGLYAIYYGVEPPLLLQSTETYGEWDVVTQIRAVHFEKLLYVIGEALNGYTSTDQ